MHEKRINVLIVEDSPVMQLLLKHVVDADPYLRVAGTADDAEAALAFLEGNHPDVVLMDVHLPGMSGLDATRKIMETRPVPIVVCSATSRQDDVGMTFSALDAGAVAFVEKPVGVGDARFETMAHELLLTLRLMSEVKVVKRWSRPRKAVPEERPAKTAAAVKVVAIGASTGGPSTIQTILAGLPKNATAPLLIVQHIAAGFLGGMAAWLEKSSGMPVRMAAHGEQAIPGQVYLAPDGVHMGIDPVGRIALVKGPPENGLCPSVSHLFRSVAGAYGAGAVGVLLTGMGCDGAAELKLMKEKGAVTIVQDAETSVVHGMPGAAIQLGAATHVLPPPAIAAMLSGFLSAV